MRGEQCIKRNLQYAKTKAKLTEFSVPQEQYPLFKSNPDDLCFNAMHALSSYVNAELSSLQPDDETIVELKKAAAFYDASSNSSDHEQCKDGFWLLAMATYFLLENFGSAAVASDYVEKPFWYGQMSAKLYFLVRYLLKGEEPNEELELPKFVDFIQGCDTSPDEVVDEAAGLLNYDGVESHLFGKVCYVAIGTAMKFAARSLLPEFSGSDISRWGPYFSSKGACRLLWQAQKSIALAGAFAGKGLFVQLPTGSGKTCNIQLLIRSRILVGECRQAVVMAPLRALCSEIARDLANTISDVADVRQAADTLEVDTWFGSASAKPQVLVFTPEKFAYVERHAGGLIDSTDLFILDEARLIDDPSRGPAYELTIAEIRRKNPEAQMVMLSAVVSNPDEIAAWAMGNAHSYVSDEDIPRTEKSLGIMNQQRKRVDFWDLSEERESDFFVPLAFRIQVLPPIGRESKARYFPAVGDEDKKALPAREIALYMAERVINNGSVAIYVPKASYVATYFARLRELYDHGCQLPHLAGSSNRDDGMRICKLADMHYGKDGNPFDGGISIGILPHYRNLQGCLRQVVEDEVEGDKFKCVICTSTLAQGVNLPIKYLIVTGVQNGSTGVKTRDFQNLLGRVARSGKFSEGSILISDPSISEWYGNQNYNRLLNEEQSEACTSAIAKLFDDLPVVKNGKREPLATIPSNEVVNMMLEGLAGRDASSVLVERLVRFGLSPAEARHCADSRLVAFAAIETYVSGMLDQESDDIDAVSLSTSTFAFANADDTMQELLIKLFKAICETLQDVDKCLPLAVYSKTQMGIAKTELLKKWLQSSDGRSLLTASDDQQRIPLICNAYIQCLGIGDEWLDAEVLADLTNMWLQGETLASVVGQLEERHDFPSKKKPNIRRVESALSDDISYRLANCISCIVDVMEPVVERPISVELQNALMRLHEKVKYGIASPLGCAVCREIFADRMVAGDMVEILGHADQGSGEALHMLTIAHAREINEYLPNLPAYFLKRFRAWQQRG